MARRGMKVGTLGSWLRPWTVRSLARVGKPGRSAMALQPRSREAEKPIPRNTPVRRVQVADKGAAGRLLAQAFVDGLPVNTNQEKDGTEKKTKTKKAA